MPAIAPVLRSLFGLGEVEVGDEIGIAAFDEVMEEDESVLTVVGFDEPLPVAVVGLAEEFLTMLNIADQDK